MLANKLGRGLLALNRLGTVARNRTVLYSKHYRGEFWDKNVNRLQRPMSPHLSVYRLPLTAITSITFRVSGACMTVAVIGFGVGSFFFAGNFDKILDWMQTNVHPHVLLAMKFILSFPIVYHPILGLRHLVWDTGRHFDMKRIVMSGWTLATIAIIGTVILALSDL